MDTTTIVITLLILYLYKNTVGKLSLVYKTITDYNNTYAQVDAW